MAAALVWIPALCGAATLSGPSPAPIAESGLVDAQNFGLAASRATTARVDELSGPDDCGRTRESFHFAETEYTWTLVCSPGQTYMVTTKYVVLSAGNLYGDVDDGFDCDFASMWNRLRIKNDNLGESFRQETHAEEVSNPPEEGPYTELEVWSGSWTSGCNRTNGAQFSCTVRIESSAYVQSEAVASASHSHTFAGCLFRLDLCTP